MRKLCTCFLLLLVINASQAQSDCLDLDVIVNNVSCFGLSDGAIILTPFNGVSPYQYSIDGGNLTVSNVFTNLAAGNYIVYGEDAVGCDTTISVSVNEPPPLSISATLILDVTCFGGNDGIGVATASGGTPPYSYTWDTGDTNSPTTHLDAGIHCVTVEDINECTADDCLFVFEPAQLSVNATPNTILCGNDNTGTIDLTINGGVPPFAFLWSDGQTIEDLIGLQAGNYCVTITDNNGCATTTCADVLASNALAVTVNSTNVLCFGDGNGQIDLAVSGGSGVYTYQWDNGSTIEDLTGLLGGTYCYTVTDGGVCSFEECIIINEPPPLIAGVFINGDVLCFGESNGEALATGSGGTLPYTYTWDNGETTALGSHLSEGVHHVTVTDANGCSDTAAVLISEPTELIASAVGETVFCSNGIDGDIDLTVSGGTLPYTFGWSNGANTEDLTGLPAGTYCVTVYDSNGCIITTCADIIATNDFALTANFTNLLCFGDSDATIDLAVSGGSGQYTFLWDNGSTMEDLSGLSSGNYCVTVSDGGSCVIEHCEFIYEPTVLVANVYVNGDVFCFGENNGTAEIFGFGGILPYTYAWDNGETDAIASMLVEGLHVVTITDGNGCTATDDVLISEPAELVASAVGETVICSSGTDGDIDLSVSGGTMPFNFIWSTGETTEDLSGLPNGNYCVTVIDANGCLVTTCADILATFDLTVTAIGETLLCNSDSDGDIDLDITGGTPPYDFVWSDATGSTIAGPPGLTAGLYSVVVSDANGCLATSSTVITEPSLLQGVMDITQVDCGTEDSGATLFSVSGGTPPYAFLWSNGATTSINNDLDAGTYTVTVTDFNGCSLTGEAIVPEAINIEAEVVFSTETCFGDDGTATVNVISGAPPHAFFWSTGDSGQTVNNLPSGTYTVSVTGNTPCVEVVQFTITSNVEIEVSSTFTSCDTNDGTATATVISGATNPIFEWSNGATTATVVGLAPGGYSVTVTDLATHCFVHRNVMIAEDPACHVIISGYALYDNENPDCIEDMTTVPLANRYIDIEPGGGTFTNAVGFYLFEVDAGDYDLTITPYTFEQGLCPADEILSVSAPTPGQTYTDNNFFMESTQINDLCIWVCMGPARPGFTQWHNIYYCNYGEAPISGTINITHDSQLINFNANGTEDSYDPAIQTATWSFNDLPPNTCWNQYFYLYVPPETPIGTQVYGSASIDLPPGDINPSNNDFPWAITVTGSYDPNDKMNFAGEDALGGDILLSDSVFHYQIRFQNTGTDTAFTVVLRDLIDPNLDISSIIPIGASHEYRMDVENENELVVWFDNIMLPDSNVNEPASHGFFLFDIKWKDEPDFGTVFENQAAIYFDFNEPILTNIVVNTLTNPVSVPHLPEFQIPLEVFPNPTKGDVTIEFSLPETEFLDIDLLDVKGKIVGKLANRIFPEGNHQLNFSLEKIPAGVYLMRLNTEFGQSIKKLVVVE
ncbi:MAG: T9SS type A sorting domain-containing protein [Bacteroidota bacterium]